MSNDNTVVIEYEVQDGYVGGSRPHKVRLDIADFEYCDTAEDIERVIDDCVNDHFREHITPSWDPGQIADIAARVYASRERDE
jgi:hypothetical protein